MRRPLDDFARRLLRCRELEEFLRGLVEELDVPIGHLRSILDEIDKDDKNGDEDAAKRLMAGFSRDIRGVPPERQVAYRGRPDDPDWVTGK